MAPPIPMLFIFLKKPDTFFPLFSTVLAFTITFSKCLLSLLLLMLPPIYQLQCRLPGGEPVRAGKALEHVYFLLFGQPSLDCADDWVIVVLCSSSNE